MASARGYLLSSYGQMVTCEPRMSAYAEALRRAVTPGCTVIDVGAGPGVLSILACKFGAGSVIAVDPSETVELIPALAEANGCAERISVIRGLSTDFVPDSKADVIVSDLRGILPLFEGHIPAISDARERLLAPGGTLIPSRDVLRVALVSHAQTYRAFEEPWLRNGYALDLSGAHRFAVNAFVKVNVEQDALLSSAQDLAVLDYWVIDHPDVVGRFDLEAHRNGVAHGLLVWFDAELAPGIGFSNEPGKPRLIYGQTFFPFERAVELEAGDRVTGEIGARLLDGNYVWTWSSRFFRSGEELKPGFRQSTFLAKVFAPDMLATRSETFTPAPDERHEVDRFCLSCFDGKNSLAEIAQELQSRFPHRYAALSDALNHVTRLASRYEQGSAG
jgi:protein arginine N-methyltransferase 1